MCVFFFFGNDITKIMQHHNSRREFPISHKYAERFVCALQTKRIMKRSVGYMSTTQLDGNMCLEDRHPGCHREHEDGHSSAMSRTPLNLTQAENVFWTMHPIASLVWLTPVNLSLGLYQRQ